MGLLKIFQKQPASKPLDMDEKKTEKKSTMNSLKSLIIKNMGLLTYTDYNRGQFISPEYNLEEIREASEADSYIKMALMRYSYLIYKAGWTLKGDNEQALEYIRKRFRLMSFSTGKPMDILFQEVADDLVRYSNAFLVKARVDRIPNVKAKPILDNKKVVAGYFRVDPASIRIERDATGNVKRYIQGYGENQRTFTRTDVVHIYMDRDANNAFGTPRIKTALEDVQLLRKIEGNIVSLIYRFSRPIFHWKIGTTQPGFQATDPDISKAEREAERMSYESMVITNEKTEIKAIGAEGTALNAEGYLKYFEERVFTALGVSASQMGRGGAKQDSESMEAQVHDTVKYIQRVISAFIENSIIGELLLEGGFDPINNEKDIISYEFEEISLETKIKKENHEMLKYQSNQITFEESRRKMGMKDTVEDEERLYKNMIDKKSRLAEIDRTAEHQKEMAKINAANRPAGDNKTTGSGGGSNKPKSSKGDTKTKAVETNNRPKNQHGTHSAKIKEFTEAFDLDNKKKAKKEFKYIYNKYEELKQDLLANEDIDLVVPLIREDITNDINKKIQLISHEAIQDATKELSNLSGEHLAFPKDEIFLTDFYEESEIAITNILDDIKEKLNKMDEEGKTIDDVFEVMSFRFRFAADYLLRKTYWYSYIKAGSYLNSEKAYVIFSGEKDKKDKDPIINTNAFSYSDIPAYHSFCKCSVTFDKKKYDKQK